MVIGALLIAGLTAIKQVILHAEARVTYGWYQQAWAAGDAVQFAEYMDNLLREMEARGMTVGYSAILIRNPGNDMAVDYQVMQRLRERADAVAKYDAGSMDYAKSLEEMRQQLDAAHFSPETWLYVQRHKVFYVWVFIAYILAVVMLVWGLLESTK